MTVKYFTLLLESYLGTMLLCTIAAHFLPQQSLILPVLVVTLVVQYYLIEPWLSLRRPEKLCYETNVSLVFFGCVGATLSSSGSISARYILPVLALLCVAAIIPAGEARGTFWLQWRSTLVAIGVMACSWAYFYSVLRLGDAPWFAFGALAAMAFVAWIIVVSAIRNPPASVPSVSA